MTASLTRVQTRRFRSKGPHLLRLTLAAAAVVALGGCVPVVGNYVSVDAPQVRQLWSGVCEGDVGPPDVAYFPFNGIFISLRVYPLVLGLHVPDGMVAQLESGTVSIDGATKRGPFSMSVSLTATAREKTVGTDAPTEFLRLPDPFKPGVTTTLGPLPGASLGATYFWYIFSSLDPRAPHPLVAPPAGIQTGTIALPAIRINGKHYEGPVLRLDSRKYWGVTPVNC